MEPGFDFGFEPEKLGLHDYQVVTGKERKHTPDLSSALKAAEKSQKPRWSFRSTDPESTKTLVVDAAAEVALRTFVAVHGKGFKRDPSDFMSAYREHTYDPCTVDEWNTARRIKLLTAGIADLVSRARMMAASNFMEDHRYVFEKPGCLRLVFYLNGYNVLEHTEEPVGRLYRAHAVEEVFQLGAEDCADAPTAPVGRRARDPRSRGAAEGDAAPGEADQRDASSGMESGALKDAKIQALESEMAALKATAEVAVQEQQQKEQALKEKRDRKAKKRADKKVAERRAKEAGLPPPLSDPTSEGARGWPVDLCRRAEMPETRESGQGCNVLEEPVHLPVGWVCSENPLVAQKKLVDSIPCGADKRRFCPLFQVGLCPRGADSAIPCCHRHEILPLRWWPVEWQTYFVAQGGHAECGGQVDTASVLSLMDTDMAAAVAVLPRATRQEALRYHLHTRMTNLSK